MSYGLTAEDWADVPADEGVEPPPGSSLSDYGLTVLPTSAPIQEYRSALLPVAFAVPVVVSGLGYLGDIAFLSDAAFLLITALCGVLLAVELMTFGRRLGIGAILLYGGVLIWFCHDYASNWFLHDYQVYNEWFPGVRADTVARAMFYHCVFIEMMVIAFRFPILPVLEKVVTFVPEPANGGSYLGLVVTMCLIGWSAYLYTADPLPVSLVKGCLWFVPQIGSPQWTVGRTNVATSWYAYVAQVIQIGQVGGILAGVYALLVARTTAGRVLGWTVWLFWTSDSFRGERRGDIAFMVLPVLGVLFLKYHAQRDLARRVRGLKWLLATGAVLGGLWYAVQYQTADRTGSALNLFRASGNTMFSEGLNSWVLIPDRKGFVYDDIPGETIVRPIPDTLWWLATGPIPRMIWKDKPIEKFALWYSALISKDNRGVLSGGAEGTTVSSGAVGYWYFRYGPAGVVEGGLLYGFMMGLCERALRRAQGRPVKIMFAFMFGVFLFRSYRDLWWHNLDPVMIGAIVMWLLIRLVFGSKSNAGVPVPGSATPTSMPAFA